MQMGKAIIGEDDGKEFEKTVRVNQDKPVAVTTDKTPGSASPAEPAIGGDRPGSPADTHRAFAARAPALPVGMAAGDPTLAWARTLLPDVGGCTIHEEEKWHRRWRVRCPVLERPFSCSAVFGAERSKLAALQECLRWVWSRHELLQGQTCPFPIEALPELVRA